MRDDVSVLVEIFFARSTETASTACGMDSSQESDVLPSVNKDCRPSVESLEDPYVTHISSCQAATMGIDMKLMFLLA
jgi:hypothetical protein